MSSAPRAPKREVRRRRGRSRTTAPVLAPRATVTVARLRGLAGGERRQAPFVSAPSADVVRSATVSGAAVRRPAIGALSAVMFSSWRRSSASLCCCVAARCCCPRSSLARTIARMPYADGRDDGRGRVGESDDESGDFEGDHERPFRRQYPRADRQERDACAGARTGRWRSLPGSVLEAAAGAARAASGEAPELQAAVPSNGSVVRSNEADFRRRTSRVRPWAECLRKHATTVGLPCTGTGDGTGRRHPATERLRGRGGANTVSGQSND